MFSDLSLDFPWKMLHMEDTFFIEISPEKGGGTRILALYTSVTRRFQKHVYPNRDMPFWGKTFLNKNFTWFCKPILPLNKMFLGEHVLWKRLKKTT